MTENASELTEAERQPATLYAAILGGLVDWAGDEADMDDCRDAARHLTPMLRAYFNESILAARTAALRDEIAREIEARMGRDADYDDGLEDAADIARGGPR